MLKDSDFSKILKEGTFELSPEGELIDKYDAGNGNSKLLSIVDQFKNENPEIRENSKLIELMGKIVDYIEEENVEKLKSIAKILNQAESVSNKPILRKLAAFMRQIVANVSLSEAVLKALNMITESIKIKIIA